MTDYSEYATRDLRLIILRELAAQTDYTANEAVLQKVAEAFGHHRSRENIRAQLRWLEEAEALRLRDVSGILVATIRTRGLDHVERRIRLDGVNRPSPE
jgi:pyridoxine/pyridoxamine 5'-phosphate oxidase